MDHQKSYFWFPWLSGVTIAASLSGSTPDFLAILNTYKTAVSPTLDLLCHEDFNVGRSEAESNIEIFMAR